MHGFLPQFKGALLAFQFHECIKELGLFPAQIQDFILRLEAIDLQLQTIHDIHQFVQLAVDESLRLETGFQTGFFGIIDVDITQDVQEILSTPGKRTGRAQRKNVRAHYVIYSKSTAHLANSLSTIKYPETEVLTPHFFQGLGVDSIAIGVVVIEDTPIKKIDSQRQIGPFNRNPEGMN